MAKQSSMIRDLVINVKSNDLAKTATEAEKLVSALVDAAEGGEMLKAELNSVKTSLLSVNKDANTTLGIFNNFALNEKFKSSLNQVLEGVNRISAAAKNLKGLDIGISLKVDNLTQLQQQVSKSIQGLDISINLKAGNLNSTNDRMQALVSNMQDAAAGVELLNSQLATTKTMVSSIKTDADAAAYSLAKVAISKNLENGLDDVVHALNMISEEIVQLNMDSKDSFADMTNAIDTMDDSLGAINKTLHQTKFATKEVGNSTKQVVDGITNIGKSNKSTSDRVAEANRGMRNQSRIMGDLAKVAGPLPAAYAVVAANVWALTSAFEYLTSGDQLNRLEKIGTVIGANIGLPVQSLARQMVEVTNGAINYEAALRKAANASGYGFSSDELAKMTEVARRAAVVMGVDMDDALNRIIKGVSKQEIELLDELGITVRLTEAQDLYAKQLGVSSDSLTSYQKQQAYLQAVLAQSEKAFGFLTKSDLGATAIERLGAAVSSTKDNLAQLLATLANNVLGDFLKADAVTEATAKIAELRDTYKSLQDALAKGNLKAASKLAGTILDTTTVEGAKARIKELKEELKASGLTYNETTNSVEGLATATSGMNNIVGGFGATQSMYNSNVFTGNTALILHKKSIEELINLTPKYSSMVDLQTKSTAALVKEYGYLDTFSGGEVLIRTVSEISGSIDALEKTGRDGINKFRDSIKDTKDPITDYNTSLQEVIKNYEMIDKLKVNFPMIPQAVIDKLKSYVDKTREAMGFNSREAVGVAADRGKAYANFITNTKDTSERTSAQTELQALGGLSGEAEVKNATRQLQEYRTELELIKKVGETTTGGEQLANRKTQLELETKIAKQEAAVNSAQLALLGTTQQLAELSVKRFAATQAASNTSATGVTLNVLQAELDLQKQNIKELGVGRLAKEQLAALNEGIYDKQLLINAAVVANNIAQIDYNQSLRESEAASNTFLQYMAGIPTEITAAALAQNELNAALAKEKELTSKFEKGDSGVKADQVVAAKIATEQARYAAVKAEEAKIAAAFEQKSTELKIEAIRNNLSEEEVMARQLEIERAHTNELEKQKLSKTEITKQTLSELEAMERAAKVQEQRQRDMVAGGIGAIKGENQAQYTSTYGLDAAQAKLVSDNDKLANVANSFDQLASYDQPFANVAANLSQMAIAIQDNAGAMEIASIAGQTITSMFQMNGQAAVDAIDAQIAAEKKRDGTSEESLAKIKALEAKKIETTRKTARQTIIMQTAVGVANALAMGNPMIGIPMAIAVGAMGLQALKAADSAAESSLAGLDSSATTGSLTLGDRANKVDTAQTANSGELSYIQGATGTGGIQTFTPRASGGSANAGYSYIAGEKGPELITPKIDSVVSDAQSTRSGGSASIGGITLNVNAIDARSFQDLVYANPQIFKDAVEMTLNQQGKTLG